ncbi:MAG: hypothetical protein JW863_06955 [Chitinispirillaceae bacterium]|nr:hypothetical protein [Chitinispirillaceae bacterium]
MLNPSECTLYSGGHAGAETFFGECAEKHGVSEVTYSYEGHLIKREKNVVFLGDAELKRGDISMEIVSAHMHRTYSNAAAIRRVFQSIFHMINNGQQIFAVGVVQDDNTVKGGTGWGIELGKFFNRDVHVYDTVRNCWLTWRHGEWIMEIPTIIEKTFVGTGTRNLTDESRQAISDLFDRSFGEK